MADKHPDIEQNETPSPDERHREFSRENERWNEEMEKALRDLDELVEGSDSSSPEGEPTSA